MQFSFTYPFFVNILRTDDNTTSPLSIAVGKGHFNIVKHFIENTTGKNHHYFWKQKIVTMTF